ncbi:MAG: hypothetical protein IPJ30_11120 [Acidobacteria bacterium]|nr:hypothetical protein [Acidobacteriota bacterium]
MNSAELQLADMQSSVLQSPESFAFIKSNNFIFETLPFPMNSAELQLADMQSSVLQSPESFAFIKSNNFIFMQGPVRWSDSPLPEFTVPDGSSIRETLNIMAKAKRGGRIIRLFRSKDYKFAIVLNI